MHEAAQLTVTVCQDEAAGVWYVHDSDLPGLHAEAPTLDALVAAIEDVVPDLIEGNLPRDGRSAALTIPVCVQHFVKAKPANAA